MTYLVTFFLDAGLERLSSY